MSPEPSVAHFAWILEHGAVAVLDAGSRDEALCATARALRCALSARATFVAVNVGSNDPRVEAQLQVVAIDGDARLIPPSGTVLSQCAGLESVGRARPARLAGSQFTGSLLHTGARFDIIVVPLDEGVGCAVVGNEDDDALLHVAAGLGVVLRTALERQRAREEALDRAHTVESLVAIHQVLAAADIEEAFPQFAEELSQAVSLSSAFLAVATPGADGLQVLVAHGPHALPPGRVLPLAEGPLGTTLRGPHVRSGVSAVFHGEAARSVVPDAHIVAIVPLVAEDAVLGALVLAEGHGDPTTARLHWAGRRRAVLHPIAHVLAPALERGLRLTRKAEAVRDWQTAFDAVDAMVVLVDGSGVLRRANYPFARRFGMGLEAVVGRRLVDFFPGAVSIAQSITSAGPSRVNWTGPSGEPLYVSIHGMPDGGAVLTLLEARRTSPAPPPPGQSYASLRRVGVPRGRLLIVDDEPSILRAVTRTLSRFHDVATAGDGDEALEILRRERFAFDVVMTDVQMSRIGGIELYRCLEREAAALTERVVFMTGGFFGPEIEAFLRAMQGRVVRKPFDPEALRRVIDARVTTYHVA